MQRSKWWSIGGSLFAGLFVAYLDRTNLSVAMPQLSRDLGFAGEHFAVTASWTLTIFLVGYALANILGGIVTRRMDPKTVVIWCFAIWSAATLVVGFTGSVAVLLICRLILGVAEGIYWPQQSRFVRGWFADNELTKANAIIQFYGQYFALAIGFMVLTPIYDFFGWHTLFFVTGGIGLAVIVPLFLAMLRPESEAPYRQPEPPRPATETDAARPGGSGVRSAGVQLHHPGHAVLGHYAVDSAGGPHPRLHRIEPGAGQRGAVRRGDPAGHSDGETQRPDRQAGADRVGGDAGRRPAAVAAAGSRVRRSASWR